jgi:hypothetical protein
LPCSHGNVRTNRGSTVLAYAITPNVSSHPALEVKTQFSYCTVHVCTVHNVCQTHLKRSTLQIHAHSYFTRKASSLHLTQLPAVGSEQSL